MEIFKNISLEELKKMATLIDVFENKEDFIKALEYEIQKREEERNKSLNARFDMQMFIKYNMFYADELNVLKMNNINNLQDLIECDLDSLIGITESIKEKLDWARNFYNLERTNNQTRRRK